jgi:hypothetical protein
MSNSEGMVFPHEKIHKCIWTCPDGKMCNQIGHVLHANSIDILDVLSLRAGDCGTDLVWWWLSFVGGCQYVKGGE